MTMSNEKKGRILILSGPSGSGKGTIVKELLKRRPDTTRLSVSATTREPRQEDVEGVTYCFYSKEEFGKLIENGGMLEYAEYCGNFYGTRRAPVEKALDEGIDVILEIEVQGAYNVKGVRPDAHMVFVMPPSARVLKERLTGRGSETEETLTKRLSTAVEEMDRAGGYDYILINDDLTKAVDELETVLDGELRNVESMEKFIKGVQNDVKTFCQ